MADKWWRRLAVGLMVALIAGCGPRYAVAPEAPLRSASLHDILNRLDRRTEAIQTLKALMTIHSDGQGSVTASLFYSRAAGTVPTSLRVNGFDPFGRTLFDLIWSNHRVLLKIPSQGRVLEGVPDRRGEPSLPGELGLEAGDLHRAVSAVVGPFVESGEIPVLEEVGSNYLVHLFRVSGGGGRLMKRLWIERTRFQLIREEIYEPADSRIRPDSDAVSENDATVVEFFDYQARSVPAGAEIEWPDRLVITTPRSGSAKGRRLELKFLEVHPNAVISRDEYQMP